MTELISPSHPFFLSFLLFSPWGGYYGRPDLPRDSTPNGVREKNFCCCCFLLWGVVAGHTLTHAREQRKGGGDAEHPATLPRQDTTSSHRRHTHQKQQKQEKKKEESNFAVLLFTHPLLYISIPYIPTRLQSDGFFHLLVIITLRLSYHYLSGAEVPLISPRQGRGRGKAAAQVCTSAIHQREHQKKRW